jgi:hypothetical protein
MSSFTKSSFAKLSAVALASATLVPLAATQANAAMVKTGLLTCDMSPGISAVIGSRRSLDCIFEPTHNGPVEHYQGQITKVGIDLGYIKSGKFAWAVFAPSSIDEGALQGNYGGLGGNVTVGFGGGVEGLVGGFDGSIALQPLSIESTLGANLAANLTALNLTYTPAAAPVYKP